MSVDSTIARALQHAAWGPGKVYGSRANRVYLRSYGIRCMIPEKAYEVRNRKKLSPAEGCNRHSRTTAYRVIQ
ncbi:hypothetical protein [Streptomyces sp. NPDC047009]|uniref:hypothetical protein n=1 Tax=unclassified Streptomyces TaxID=2593676 RepID=UPI0033F39F2A